MMSSHDDFDFGLGLQTNQAADLCVTLSGTAAVTAVEPNTFTLTAKDDAKMFGLIRAGSRPLRQMTVACVSVEVVQFYNASVKPVMTETGYEEEHLRSLEMKVLCGHRSNGGLSTYLPPSK